MNKLIAIVIVFGLVLSASVRALSRNCRAHSSVPTSWALTTPSAMTTTMRPSRLSGR